MYEKKEPEIRVVGIDSELDKNALEKDILKRNNFPDNGFKIVHLYKQKNKSAFIAQVSSEVYNYIMRTYKTVFIGYQNLRSFNVYNDSRCINCNGYGHRAYKKSANGQKILTCKRDKACAKCSGNHDTKTCQSAEKKCINCISANKFLVKKRDITHSADDIFTCESYKIRWEKHVSSTDYPWRPEEPYKRKI